MKHFATLNSRQFAARTKYYKDKGALENTKFWEYLANAFERYTKTGRVDYVNNADMAARNVGRFRQYVRVCKSLMAHKYDEKQQKFVGKADKKKLKRLRAEVKDGGGILRWEKEFYDHLQKETAFGQQKPAKAWDEDAVILAFVKNLARHGVTPNSKDVISRIEKASKDVEVKVA